MIIWIPEPFSSMFGSGYLLFRLAMAFSKAETSSLEEDSDSDSDSDISFFSSSIFDASSFLGSSIVSKALSYFFKVKY